jgi:hypothetical protein
MDVEEMGAYVVLDAAHANGDPMVRIAKGPQKPPTHRSCDNCVQQRKGSL